MTGIIQLGNITLTDEAGGSFLEPEPVEDFGPDIPDVRIELPAVGVLEEAEPAVLSPDEEEPDDPRTVVSVTSTEKDTRTNKEKFDDRMTERQEEKDLKRKEQDGFLCSQCQMNDVDDEDAICDSCNEANGTNE